MRSALNDQLFTLLTVAYRKGAANPDRHGGYGQYEPDLSYFADLITPMLGAAATEAFVQLSWEDRRTLLYALRQAYVTAARTFTPPNQSQFAWEIPGTVWSLTHTQRGWNGGGLRTDVNLYVDPRTAVADLARHARQGWDLMRQHPLRLREKFPVMPELPPVDDAAVVALYYWHSLPEGAPGHALFYLEAKAVNPFRNPESLAGWVLINGGEVECGCGNEAAGDGFEYADADGTITGPQGSCEFLVCMHCNRHIDAATGRVLGVLDDGHVQAGLEALETQRFGS